MRFALISLALLGLVVLPARGEVVVVLNSGEGTVSIIDRATLTETKRVPIGREPHHLIPTLNETELVVANAASNNLAFLDPKSGEIKRRVGNISDPYQLAYSADGKWFLSISIRIDFVDVYSMPDYTLVKRFKLSKAPSHVAVSNDSKLAYVTLQDSNEIAAIDLSKMELAWRKPVGKTPAGIWISPDDKHVFVGIMGENYVEVIDPAKRETVKKLVTGDGAHNIFPVGDGKRVLVSNRVSGTITFVDYQSLTVGDSIKVPGGPDCMEITADGKQAWITQRWIQKVGVVDLESKKIIAQIPVGRSPHGIYFRSHAARK